MSFTQFSRAVHTQLNKVTKQPYVFRVNIAKDKLWKLYLESFPEGTDPIYKTETTHTCNCCKNFIRDVGTIVGIDRRGNTITPWGNTKVPAPYDIVTKKLDALIKNADIKEPYFHYQNTVGQEHTNQTVYVNTIPEIITWNHFFGELPNSIVMRKDAIATELSQYRAIANVFRSSLEEITTDAVDQVLDLISQKSIYRGEEHLPKIKLLQKHQTAIAKLKTFKEQDKYIWINVVKTGASLKIKNTVIGTLLMDLSEGIDLIKAVKKFETKVAPQNYKRPTALITKAMIDKAQKTVAELGLEGALYRRYAVEADLSVNNVIFVNRDTELKLSDPTDVFSQMKSEVTVNVAKFDKVEEVNIDKFIKDIVPTATSIEMMFDNKHTNNLVSLIAPKEKSANPILQWNNNFSWAYKGEVTDSIKDRVKAAGGNITGVIRCSLAWFNSDDLDIHIIEPSGNKIFFGQRSNHKTTGNLDVDMNAGSNANSLDPVENITWSNPNKMNAGEYRLIVNNYDKRNSDNVGFNVEIECDGVIHSYHFSKAVMHKENIAVATFNWSKTKGLKIIKSIKSTIAAKEVWNIKTQTFHNVNMIMNSPNYWDDNKSGNKHWFFMLDKCTNPEATRGFFNEFLRNDLHEHRKVFEMLSSKTKVEPAKHQLSGLGFSSTNTDSILIKVKGSFERMLKIIF